MKKTIAILGCGWLGFPLAKKLITDGYVVKGSTTSEEKLPQLSSAGIKAFKIKLGEEKTLGEISSFLKGVATLIICVPPGFRKSPTESFVKKIETVLPEIEASDIKNVLYISSTSVYADTENFQKTGPNAILDTSATAKELIKTENIFIQNTHFASSVLRLSGLFGKDRHPVYYLAGKTGIKNPEAPINLIHQEDVIALIRLILTENFWGKTFTVSFPFHPSKEDYYTAISIKLNLEPPVFDHRENSKGKMVSDGLLEKELGFTFIHSPKYWPQ